MADTIIEGMRAFIASCPLMSELTKGYVDWTDEDNDSYGIYPDGDDRVGDPYIDGSCERKYVLSIIVKRMALTDADRLHNSAFTERLQDWFDTQEAEGNIPELPENCGFNGITAANGMLLETNKTGTKGTYQLQIIVEYTKYVD